MRNPWSESRTVLVLAANDEWGIRASELKVRRGDLEKKTSSLVNWEDYTGIHFPITTEKQAISYARTLYSAEQYAEGLKRDDYKVKYDAYFDQEDETWTVWVIATQADDLSFEIHFEMDGTVLMAFHRSI
jgi:hypothetical protein